MSSSAARICRLSIVVALALTACSGGGNADVGSSAKSSTAASSDQNAPAPPPAVSLPVPAEATFVNPLLASGPDPYVIRTNGVYYYTQTSGDRIGLWATTAMSRLSQASHVTIFVPPSSGANSRDLWAPELHYLDNKWYIYYAAGDGSSTPNDPYSSQRMFVLENDQADPMQGTWTDKGRLYSPDQDAWAIDGTVMEYGGQRYFIWSGRASADDSDQHIYIAKMLNPWTLAEGRVMLSSPDHDWERSGTVGVNEAPQVLYNPSGSVFLLYSANGCWTDNYSLGMLTLRAGGDPLVPADWVKSDQPVFGKNPANGAFGPGHNSFFKSPDGTQDWLIYHANSSAGEGCGDTRNPRMQPIKWRDDGTPDFATPAPMSVPIPVPSGDVLEY
jgi:GH43 family beta-xylosidase